MQNQIHLRLTCNHLWTFHATPRFRNFAWFVFFFYWSLLHYCFFAQIVQSDFYGLRHLIVIFDRNKYLFEIINAKSYHISVLYRTCGVHSPLNRQIFVLLFIVVNIHHVTDLAHSPLKPFTLILASPFSILT